MKASKVYRYDLSGKLVAEYASMREFERATGICRKRASQLKLLNKAVSGKDLQLIQFKGKSYSSTEANILISNITSNVVITNDSIEGRFILFDAPVKFK